MHQRFKQRFDELEASYRKIHFQSRSDGYGSFVPDGQWHGWATNVQHLIRAVFGESSAHFRNFAASYGACHGGESDVRTLHSIFLAARSDFDGGYTFNVELRVSGEVFGDFVVLAKQALSEGHKDVAVVLACAALEDALKRFATANGLSVEGKTMAEVISALKSGGFVSGAQKTLLDAMPRIRNMALHADWAKISDPDVNSVLGFVEQFLLTHFST